MRLPQAFVSTYANRLRTYNNALLTPVMPQTQAAGPISRTTKRGTTVINYAEDGYDDYEDDDSDAIGRRRPTGLRSLRREDSAARADPFEKVGKDATAPVAAQPVHREWMTRRLGEGRRSDAANHAQAALPVTLVPIRVDVEIPAYVPPAPFPMPQGATAAEMQSPAYRPQEMTVPYRLKDTFLWNLHEALVTTDMFALRMVDELDLPNKQVIAADISKQIRTQLEEYAGVALHPLFHSQPQPKAQPQPSNTNVVETTEGADEYSRGPATPTPAARMTRDASLVTGTGARGTPTPAPAGGEADVTAEATAITEDSSDFNPDDTYRCIISLNINLSSTLYTDKFEWSLLHPPGTAELFARQTCADMGLAGEWVPAIAHAIYEAVLRLKKEACEAGGLVLGWGSGGGGGSEHPNDAAHGAEAGWRYDPEHLADEWEPRIEVLSKEEIERREGDRERQIRRMRRETARFSSTAGMFGGVPSGALGGFGVVEEEERMGRGERSKKKRRFRSLSPVGRSGTPGGRGTPDAGYGGGGGGSLADNERREWRCQHCKIWGSCVWAVRDGPAGPRVSILLDAAHIYILVSIVSAVYRG